jgi:hypothetical protein
MSRKVEDNKGVKGMSILGKYAKIHRLLETQVLVRAAARMNPVSGFRFRSTAKRPCLEVKACAKRRVPLYFD